MSRIDHSREDDHVSGRFRKSALVIGGCLGGLALAAFIAVVVFVGTYFLAPKQIDRPLIVLNSPQNGVQLETGRRLTVQAFARDDAGVKRVELWVDGELKEIETSSLEGGISPFPLLSDWFPTSAGSHSLIVRAFNTQGARTHASINVEVVEGVDSDADGLPNENDSCPSRSGPGDTNGCPPPGDIDYDSIADEEDACPDEAGPPELAGCPDRDSDGISDRIDLCPDFPGPSESGGCPDTGAGDSDGDTVPDDVDLAVDEPGLPSHGGAPSPGSGEDEDGDGIADTEETAGDPLGDWFGGILFQAYVAVPVEIEALEFSVDEDYEYDSVWCYVNVADGGMERYGPFELSGDIPLGNSWHWDIYEVLGGANSAHLMVRDEPISIEIECGGEVLFPEDGGAWGTVYNLGSVSLTHPRDEWDGTNRYAYGEGDDGRGFQLKYRVCEGACEGMLLQPPVVSSHIDMFDSEVLEWSWSGDREMLAGYRLYFNSALFDTIRSTDDYISINSGHDPMIAWMLRPPCETTYELYVTAFDDLGRESPPSNTLALTGERCPLKVRVTFLSLQTYDLPDDLNQNACEQGPGAAIGPIDVTLMAQSSSIHLNSRPTGINTSQGMCLEDFRSYTIMELMDECRESIGARSCSDVDFVEVNYDPDEDLTIFARIVEWDWDVGHRLWQGNQTFRVDEVGPIEYSLVDNEGGMVYPDIIQVIFRVDPPFDEP